MFFKIMSKIQIEKYPKISIITCVLNGEKYIHKLLDSVLNMGYPNIEHIIVNDGSTDQTEEIIKHYEKLYENKNGSNLTIKYIKQTNKGLGSATNTGLREITGEYWTWINCDDWYETNAFNYAIDFLLKNTKYSYVQLNGFRYKEGSSKKLIIKNWKKHSFYNKKKLICNFTFKLTAGSVYVCTTLQSYRNFFAGVFQ